MELLWLFRQHVPAVRDRADVSDFARRGAEAGLRGPVFESREQVSGCHRWESVWGCWSVLPCSESMVCRANCDATLPRPTCSNHAVHSDGFERSKGARKIQADRCKDWIWSNVIWRVEGDVVELHAHIYFHCLSTCMRKPGGFKRSALTSMRPIMLQARAQSDHKNVVLLSGVNSQHVPSILGICTRFATEVILRRKPDSEIRVTIELGPSRLDEEERRPFRDVPTTLPPPLPFPP